MTTTAPLATGVPGFDAADWLAEHGAGDVLMTPDGWITDANRPIRRTFRLPAGQEPRGLNFRRFCRQPARLAEAIDAIRSARFISGWDADLVTFDLRPVHAVVNLVGEFHDGFLTAIRVQLFDISDWRRGQERTLFGQRIEAIGRLAGGVAHDFNNLLMVITGHAECLSVAFPPDSPMTRSVAAIQASATRAAALTDKLLSFGRRQVLQPALVDPADLLRRVEAAVRRAAGTRFVRETEATSAWCVRVDPVRLEAAIGAIAAHARESLAQGGTLALRASNLDVGPEWSPTRTFVKPGRFVRIDVICAGMTIDADTHVRMFEPFFSERATTGDGMGLAAAFGTVKQSGGYMWIESDRPGETVFTVLLPAVEDGPDGRAVTTAAPPTLLVVESDDAVRSMIVKVLAHRGYVVLGAAGPAEAERLGQSGPIDVLIAEQVPDRPWSALVTAIGTGSPALRVLGLVSPGAENEPADAATDAMATLRKPFTAAELVERVRIILER